MASLYACPSVNLCGHAPGDAPSRWSTKSWEAGDAVMRECEVEYLVRMPQERLWDYLSDYETLLQLASSDFRQCGCRLLKGSAGVEGATYEAWMKWTAIQAQYTATLEVASRPKSILWGGYERGISCSLRFELRPFDEDVTVVVATFSISVRNSPLLTEPLGWELLDPAFGHVVRELQAL